MNRVSPARLFPLILLSMILTDGTARAQGEPPVRLSEIIVTPSRFGISDAVGAPAATLTAQELAARPQVGEDLFRVIARLPGLAADDFTARFWVRGAPNGQVAVRLDGLDLVEPFHLKDIDGALSIVDLPTVRRLDLYTGGFTADYGDRLAGVLALETATAPTGRERTSLGVSATSLRVSHAGRTSDGRAEWRLTARRGYPDLALRLRGREDDIFPRYHDLAVKAEWALAPGQRLSVHALHALDTLRFQETGEPALNSRYRSDSGWIRWRGEWSSGLVGETVLGASRLGWNRQGDGFFDQRLRLLLNDDRGLTLGILRSDWSRPLSERVFLRAGAALQRGTSDYAYGLLREETVIREAALVTERRTEQVRLSRSGTGAALFVSPRVALAPGWIAEAGLRAESAPARPGEWEALPRFNLAWNATPHTTLRAAWGRHAQAQGLHELSVPDGERTFASAERAEHRVLGLEQRLPKGLLLRAEMYQRKGYQRRPRWENLVSLYNVFPEVQTDRIRVDPQGDDARGLELLLERRAGADVAWGWSAGYAWARAVERVGNREVPRARDQRHTLQIELNYAPNPRWSWSAAWRYHTGWPTTDVSYVLVPLANGRRAVQRVLGAPYAARLPAYHRLDLRVTRRWAPRWGEVRAYLDVFNAYDRVNLLGYNTSPVVRGTQVEARREAKDLLPFLPSAGIEVSF
jgi:hypothetical protein